MIDCHISHIEMLELNSNFLIPGEMRMGMHSSYGKIITILKFN